VVWLYFLHFTLHLLAVSKMHMKDGYDGTLVLNQSFTLRLAWGRYIEKPRIVTLVLFLP
jgi:hypothetical protein